VTKTILFELVSWRT